MPNKHRYKPEIQRLLADGEHRTADQLFSTLRRTYLFLGKGTVYRTLQDLVDEGLIMKTTGIADKIIFETAKKPHGHIVCKKSGMIVDVPIDNINLDALELPLDFEVENISVRVDGHFTQEQCSFTVKKG